LVILDCARQALGAANAVTKVPLVAPEGLFFAAELIVLSLAYRITFGRWSWRGDGR
jgi:hypothetical protein